MKIDSNAPLGRTLADLAVATPSATRVFHRHGLDFCCGGRVPLAEACAKEGLDPDLIAKELGEAAHAQGSLPDTLWDEASPKELIAHILESFHADHRVEVPRLIAMAKKVEEVHADKPDCPTGLATHLEHMLESLEDHMEKEEEVLFPLVLEGRGGIAQMPIRVMESEHRDHGNNLARMKKLAHDYMPPEEACNTWRALYLGVDQLEKDLMQHIHLENNVLFPKALEQRG